MPGKAAIRRELRGLLSAGRVDDALKLIKEKPGKQATGLLLCFLPDHQPMVKWMAIHCLGLHMAGLCAADLEYGREVMRRLVWSLNEESGAVPWGCPEAMGEIMARVPALAGEFANLLISCIWPDGNYLEFEPLQAGVAWGLGRLAAEQPAMLADKGAAPLLAGLLASPDARVRGAAAWALGRLPGGEHTAALAALAGDHEPVDIFQHPHLVRATVAALAGAHADPGAAG